MQLRKEKTKLYDNIRHALQAPIKFKSEPKGGYSRYKVLYLKGKVEHSSPWYYHYHHAKQLLQTMKAKYGEKNAIILTD